MNVSGNAAYYPLFLDLKDKDCIVVGGGRVAGRKVAKLLACGAKVVVISPHLGEELEKLVPTGRIEWIDRPYHDGDLSTLSAAALGIAATNDRDVNRAVAQEAARAEKWVNVVDDTSLCSFIVPASLDLPDIHLAISTGGKHPRCAKQLKDLLERDLKDGTDTFMTALRSLP